MLKPFSHLLVAVLFLPFFFSACEKNKYSGKLPVNPDSTVEAKELLSYIYNISGKATLTGQHTVLGRMSLVTDSIYKLTGKYPGLWGGDFGFADSTHDIDNIKYRPLLVNEIKKQHARGSLITMTYHQANPVIGEPCQFEGGVVSKLSDEQWDSLTTPGTDLYEAWRTQMDLLAEHLKQLQDEKIPILFRPYHEMNGGWFWWGKRTGEEGFVKLWKQLYHYYVDVHKLNNLIWVWAPDKPSHGLKEYYPGPDYVDIIGCDIYPSKDTLVVFRKEWYDQIVELAGDIPVALSEGSILPDSSVLEEQPRWAWFMGWGNMIFQNPPERIKSFYDSERTISAEE